MPKRVIQNIKCAICGKVLKSGGVIYQGVVYHKNCLKKDLGIFRSTSGKR